MFPAYPGSDVGLGTWTGADAATSVHSPSRDDRGGYFFGVRRDGGTVDAPVSSTGVQNVRVQILLSADLGSRKGETMPDNVSPEDARKNTPDLKVTGDPGAWELVCKASSASQGWMKSTKRMQIDSGYLYQVSTEHRNPETGLVTACAEALTFVPVYAVGELVTMESQG